jgi:cytochrome P450
VIPGSGEVVVEPDHEHWLRKSGFFRTVVGYEEAVDLLKDSRLHSYLISDFEAIGVTSRTLREVASASLLNLNGERHKRYRSLIADSFTPRAAEQHRPVARDAAHELITTLEANGDCDFVKDFATPYIEKSTSHFVGFSHEETAAGWQGLELISSAMKKPINHLDARDQDLVLALVAAADSALEDRRRRPRRDILTVVADAVGRGALPEPVGLGIVIGLLSAGHEPTINQLGITVTELSRRPEIWDALGTGELKPSSVVEAVLRFRSTNQGVLRRVADSFAYRGVRFEEGEKIVVGIAAANHDPRRFSEPNSLVVDDGTPSHLSFGIGAHYCLGAALARVQLQEAVGALSERLSCPEIQEVVEWHGAGLVGPTSLAVSLSSRDR